MKLAVTVLVAALIASLCTTLVFAFPAFKPAFEEKYVKGGQAALKEAWASKAGGCNACHDPAKKTIRTPYGKELEQLIPGNSDEVKARVNDPLKKADVLKELDAAFDKLGKMKPAGSDKTYEEIIQSGKLP